LVFRLSPQAAILLARGRRRKPRRTGMRENHLVCQHGGRLRQRVHAGIIDQKKNRQ